MKNVSKCLILSLLLSFFFTTSLLAQKKNRVTQKADQAFDAEMYFEASELYKKGYKKTKNKAKKTTPPIRILKADTEPIFRFLRSKNKKTN